MNITIIPVTAENQALIAFYIDGALVPEIEEPPAYFVHYSNSEYAPPQEFVKKDILGKLMLDIIGDGGGVFMSTSDLMPANETIPHFGEIVLMTRSEGEEVIKNLRDLISRRGFASVGDLCQLVGVTSCYADEKRGWFDLQDADVQATGDGYSLRLPMIKSLERKWSSLRKLDPSQVLHVS